MRSEMRIELRYAKLADTNAIVDLHLDSFSGFFLSSLGASFLAAFYDGLRSIEDGILIVATSGPEIVGFVGGTVDQVSLYSRLLRDHRWRFIRAAALAAVQHPGATRRLVRARLRARGEMEYLPGASLMTLGVASKSARRGVGKQLVYAFIAALRDRGIAEFSLTTDARGNDGVNQFYRALGFDLARTIRTREGRILNEYMRSTEA